MAATGRPMTLPKCMIDEKLMISGFHRAYFGRPAPLPVPERGPASRDPRPEKSEKVAPIFHMFRVIGRKNFLSSKSHGNGLRMRNNDFLSPKAPNSWRLVLVFDRRRPFLPRNCNLKAVFLRFLGGVWFHMAAAPRPAQMTSKCFKCIQNGVSLCF